jgi:probable F420-dependent oxidoreductase
VAVVLDSDDESARATAREYARMYLGLSNYTNNLLRFDYTEDDIADGGSDRLIDEVVPHGSPEEIAAVAQAHIEAGADHVCLQTIGVTGVPTEQWTALAAALGLSG